MRKSNVWMIGPAMLLFLVLPLRVLAITVGGEPIIEQADNGFEALYPPSDTAVPNEPYQTFTASLPGLGLQSDGDGDGKLSDERCDTDGEAEIAEAMAGLTILTALGTACNVFPENIDIPCWIALTIVATALEATAIADRQCGLQDALVNGAEIEAIYENGRLGIAADNEEYLNDCEQIVSLRLPHEFGGRAEAIQHLVQVRINQVNSFGGFSTAVMLAQAEYDLGKSLFGMQKYREAHQRQCNAYNILVDTEE